MLVEQAGWEQTEMGSDRKELVCRLYVRAHLADSGPFRGIDLPPEERKEFVKRGLKELEDGTARLTGIAHRASNPNQAFEVDVTFSGRTDVAPPGSVVIETPSRFTVIAS